VCVGVHMFDEISRAGGVKFSGVNFSKSFFSVHPRWAFRVSSPLSYFRLVSHCVGHGSWGHLSQNIVSLLLVAPACERHFGALQLGKIMFTTALASGLAHVALGPSNAVQFGASGLVFCCILLNSLIEVLLQPNFPTPSLSVTLSSEALVSAHPPTQQRPTF